MKRCCKQCGEAKPITAFRTYYNGGTSHYKVCLVCEKINSRRKYLEKKLEPTKEETEELEMIYQLYETQREKGLAPPRKGKHEQGLTTIIAAQQAKLVSNCDTLKSWLTVDLSKYTPDELTSVYEDLRARFRPKIGMDPATVLPVYDETYKDILDKILVRFDDYEEEYYAME